MGGIVVAYELARAMGTRGIFMERDAEGRMTLRRGFELKPGESIVVAEDVPGLGPAAAWSFEHLAALLRGMLALARDAQLGALDVHAPAPLWGGLYLGAFAVAARAGRRGMLAALAGMGLLLGVLLLPMPVPGLSSAPVEEPPAYDASAVFLADLPSPPEPLVGVMPSV